MVAIDFGLCARVYVGLDRFVVLPLISHSLSVLSFGSRRRRGFFFFVPKTERARRGRWFVTNQSGIDSARRCH